MKNNIQRTQRTCCGLASKLKVINNSNQSVIPENTQVDRAVNTILFVPGGRTQYGNRSARSLTRIAFLGRLEGQPGGTLGALKNKF